MSHLYKLVQNNNEEMPKCYLYKNNIGALYAEYEGRWGSTSAKAGLRNWHTNGHASIGNDKGHGAPNRQMVQHTNHNGAGHSGRR